MTNTFRSVRGAAFLRQMAAFLAAGLLAAGAPAALAQCPAEVTVQGFTGSGRVVCPCFVPGEEAGAVFTAPLNEYPLEILRVGIAWGSQFGGTPSSLEQALHVYAGAPPNPGSPVFTLEGPVLNDGAINQFDLAPLPGEIRIDSGPFAVTLEFRNANAGNIFAPSVVSDGNGCQAGRNVVRLDTGSWSDACALGVTGDWVIFVVYRPCVGTADAVERILSTSPAHLLPPRPNPSRGPTELEYVLATPGPATLSVLDIGGRRIARLAEGHHAAGVHRTTWGGRSDAGHAVSPGVYYLELRAEGRRARRSLLVAR